ncbi:uncharacterized protein LOC116845817 isoform X2 [Odontomachus brunneus]|uniref:uncharacterized protein LOC116845817 isoform X2 n=1 Tax=Odontomachus brunneus TaxID=486640 RepID=UPI0013F1DC96|nr:uncharacterized protein LOC116845817 isoform X2 [Odontomachus brunneus]
MRRRRFSYPHMKSTSCSKVNSNENREISLEERPRIEQLLTNDYQRIWWKEKRVWDETIAEKTAGKRILPRMLIKRKVPTCVTVKYQTRTDRWMGKKKQDFVLQKSNPKKKEIERESNGNSNTTELKTTEDNDTKVEKSEEIKSENHKETQSENKKETEYEREEEREEESTD